MGRKTFGAFFLEKMGRIRSTFSRAIKALGLSKPDKPTLAYPWPPRTQAGIVVDHDNALTYAAVWACVQVICGSVSQMGWHVFRTTEQGRERVPNHVADWLLDTQANPETNAFNFREAMLRYALLWGNGYAEIERDLAGRPVWLWLITPDRVAVDRDSKGKLVYDVSNRGNSNTVFNAEDMFHLKGLGDGVTGLSVIALARQSIGLGLATEKFGSSFFGNGARPGVVLEHPSVLSEPAQERLRKNFAKKNAGDNALGVDILEEGMKLNTYSIPPDDAQFLETRVHQVLDICRWFNVKPHKVAELSRATFSNIEESNIDHVVDTCLPWVIRCEQEANIKLFGQNRQGFYTKMNVNSLLRGKVGDRFAAYATGRQWGWLTINNILSLEDMNTIGSVLGDARLIPTNMTMVSPDGTPVQVHPQATTNPQPQQQPDPQLDQPMDLEDRLREILARQVAHRGANGAVQS